MNSRSEHPGLYLHIPFCRQKCVYCDFYSITDRSLTREWLLALEKEIRLRKRHWGPFDTFYLGGGTPSLMEKEHFFSIFNLIHQHFHFIQDTEITIEANPDDITKDKLDFLQDLGVTRISLGVQSFSDEELRFLGRRHTAGQAKSALEMIRDHGFENLSIDLIYGLPQQEISRWTETMNLALDYKPEHLSCYQMTIHEGTPLGQFKAEGKIHPLNEEKERAFFLTTSEFLEQKGYIHYEISNFASNESTQSRHNSKYWQRIPYLGLGPAAHSFRGQERWWNVKNVQTYYVMLNRECLPIEDKETLTEDQQKLESLFLGLRTKAGVDLSLLYPQEKTNGAVEKLRASNLIRIDNNRIIPTLKGFAVADSLPLLFLEA